VGIARFSLNTLYGAFSLVPVAGDQHHLPLAVGSQSSGDGLANGACGTCN
jgi:hypothetical protein